jgi:hypothetical protein
MPRPDDLSRSLVTLQQDSTLIAVVELSQSSWLVAGIVPGLARHPLKKLEPDQEALLRLLRRWRDEAAKAGKTIARIAVAFEAGRDGFWLARWLRARGIEAHVIHPTSVAVSREHRRAKTEPSASGPVVPIGSTPSCSSAPAGGVRGSASNPRLAPRRAGPLRHGRGPDPRRGSEALPRTPGAPTASGRAWWASAPGS